jgi:hypothetical protein
MNTSLMLCHRYMQLSINIFLLMVKYSGGYHGSVGNTRPLIVWAIKSIRSFTFYL